MQGIRHSGFSVCSPGNQGVFEFMNITWLGSPEELRAIPEAPLFLLQCRNSPDINISWYFHEETLAFLGSGFRRCALCEGRAAASAAPSTHSAAPKSLPWASFTFKTHLYLELFSLKKIKFWLLSNTLSGLSWSPGEFEPGLAMCGSGFPLTLGYSNRKGTWNEHPC